MKMKLLQWMRYCWKDEHVVRRLSNDFKLDSQNSPRFPEQKCPNFFEEYEQNGWRIF